MNERAADKTCPECGSEDTVRIVYGFPGTEMIEAAERGEIALGGCVISAMGGDSDRRCRACDGEWTVESG